MALLSSLSSKQRYNCEFTIMVFSCTFVDSGQCQVHLHACVHVLFMHVLCTVDERSGLVSSLL